MIITVKDYNFLLAAVSPPFHNASLLISEKAIVLLLQPGHYNKVIYYNKLIQGDAMHRYMGAGRCV